MRVCVRVRETYAWHWHLCIWHTHENLTFIVYDIIPYIHKCIYNGKHNISVSSSRANWALLSWGLGIQDVIRVAQKCIFTCLDFILFLERVKHLFLFLWSTEGPMAYGMVVEWPTQALKLPTVFVAKLYLSLLIRETFCSNLKEHARHQTSYVLCKTLWVEEGDGDASAPRVALLCRRHHFLD